MKVSRRLFLGGALAIAGAVAVSPALASEVLPRIVGDGVHDDTAGLQALLDGKPVEIATETVRLDEGTVFITGGNFLISSTLHVGRNPENCIDIRHSDFRASDDFCGDVMLRALGRTSWHSG